MILALQYLLLIVLILLSAFFAGSETGVYRLSRFQMRIGVEKKKLSYKILFRMLQDGQGLIFSLLLGNNLVNNLLTSLVTLMVIRKIDDQYLAGIYATAVVTPVLFVFGEMIPKNIYYYKANTLLPFFAWMNWLFYQIFTLSGAVWALKGCSNILARVFGLKVDSGKAVDATQRHQVRQIIHETREEGLLTTAQKDMIGRLMEIPDVPVSAVMVKLQDIEKIPVDTDHDQLLKRLAQSRYARQFVYQDNPTRLLGYVNVYRLLGYKRVFSSLHEEIIKPLEINKNCSVIEAINRLREKSERIALITDTVKGQTSPVGMVSIVDLIEELTGELSD